MGNSVSDLDDYDTSEPSDDVVFSFMDGFVWASWPGSVSMVRVGRYETVTAAMRDFLVQCELGERLLNGTSKSASARAGRSASSRYRSAIST